MDIEVELAALKAEVAELRRRADVAEGYVAVSNLQRAYGYYLDKSLWDEIGDLFAKDCSLEINGRGVYLGQDRVRAYMYEFGPPKHGQMSIHMQLQPVIHVAADGQSAKMRSRSLMLVGQMGEVARWGDGVYENEYVKEDGVWKISKLHFYQTFYTEYAEGWGKSALPIVPTYDHFPPDQPPSEDYKVFPDYFLPAYHYQNPVSGG